MSKYKVRNFSELHYWLETEIAVLHILAYIIIGLLIDHWIAWVIVGVFIFGNFLYLVTHGAKLIEENKKDV